MADRPNRFRVAIVDDQQVLVESLRLVIDNEPDMEVVGECYTCQDCLTLIQMFQPNVLLMEISLPDGDGLNLVPKISQISPETNILILTSNTAETTLKRAIDAGVHGFLGKNHRLSEVLSSIRQVAEGEIAIAPSLLLGLLGRKPRERSRNENVKLRDPLTQRELEILNCLAQGKSGPEIAGELNIAPLTVRTHIRNIFEKFGVHSRLEAVSHALRLGLIESPL